MRFFQDTLEKLKRVWQDMTVPGRFGFLLLLSICLAAVGGVVYWSAQPDYRVLFSELTAADSGAITAKLQAQGVPFRLAANGTTVLVPSERMQQARVDLAVAGLPAGGAKGFEALEGSPLTMTPFLQHVTYIRAIENEIAKTVMQLEPVAFARVHIVRPEPTPFIRDQKPTTASVILKLKPGATLGRNVAAGIVAVVSSSVEGLTADNVTVIDTSGRVLSEPHGSEVGALAASNLEYRRDVETYLATKAEEMLEQSLGPSRAIVRVTADINFRRVKEKREDIDPESRVIKNERSSNRKTTPGSVATTAPSSRTQFGPGAAKPVDGSATGSGSVEEESENIYDYSKTVRDLEQEVGNIERITIAALVDLSGSGDSSGGTGMTVEQAEEIVKRAVGFKQGRDEIKVTDVKLPGSNALTGIDTEWLETQRWQNYINIARHASLAVAALAAILVARMVLKRLQPPPSEPAEAGSEQSDRARLLEQLSVVAQHNPTTVARILESWIDDSESRRKAA